MVPAAAEVAFVPPFAIGMAVPFQMPDVIVPTEFPVPFKVTFPEKKLAPLFIYSAYGFVIVTFVPALGAPPMYREDALVTVIAFDAANVVAPKEFAVLLAIVPVPVVSVKVLPVVAKFAPWMVQDGEE
jgi:hypothetical protein